MKSKTLHNIGIVIFGTVCTIYCFTSFIYGFPVFPVGDITFMLSVSLFYFVIFILSLAIKSGKHPDIYRPNLKIKMMIVNSFSWLIFAIFELGAGSGANIKVDVLYTMPLIIFITSTSTLRWLLSFTHDL